jgi:hypothetical protein
LCFKLIELVGNTVFIWLKYCLGRRKATQFPNEFGYLLKIRSLDGQRNGRRCRAVSAPRASCHLNSKSLTRSICQYRYILPSHLLNHCWHYQKLPKPKFNLLT